MVKHLLTSARDVGSNPIRATNKVQIDNFNLILKRENLIFSPIFTLKFWPACGGGNYKHFES